MDLVEENEFQAADLLEMLYQPAGEELRLVKKYLRPFMDQYDGPSTPDKFRSAVKLVEHVKAGIEGESLLSCMDSMIAALNTSRRVLLESGTEQRYIPCRSFIDVAIKTCQQLKNLSCRANLEEIARSFNTGEPVCGDSRAGNPRFALEAGGEPPRLLGRGRNH